MNEKILIGYTTGEFGRRADFYDYVDLIDIKGLDVSKSKVHSQSPAKARNIIFDQSIEGNFTHTLILDDDMAFKPSILKDLLKHDKDMVTGLYYGRNYPHKPMIFDYVGEGGQCRYVFLSNEDKGLKRIVASGFGALLIKTEILKRMEKPYVRLGELDSESWCDDIGFFLRAKLAGIELYCDLEVRCGHMGTMIIWPNKTDSGQWTSAYDTNGTSMIQVPQYNPINGNKRGIDNAVNIEGWMNPKELLWLAETAGKCETIVEFGSHCGRSTRALGDNCLGVVYAVDTWTGKYFTDDNTLTEILNGSRLEDFKHNLHDLLATGRVEYHQKKSTEFKFNNNSHRIKVEADLVFIDGDHRYEAVLEDIEHALTLVKPGGIIAGHDYSDTGWPGVKRAVDELFDSVETVESIWHVRI